MLCGIWFCVEAFYAQKLPISKYIYILSRSSGRFKGGGPPIDWMHLKTMKILHQNA